MTDAVSLDQVRIAVVGLGYVGLPLAVAFGKRRPVIGFDINPQRIAQLQAGHDATQETTPEQLAAATQLRFASDVAELAACRTFIVTVPTPVDDAMQPDLTPLEKASATVGSVLKAGDVLLNEAHHTAMYIGNGQIVHASGNEHGGATGGLSGDQTGRVL